MSTVQEIKSAIQNLTSTEREELIAELPKLLPELNGDLVWDRLIKDERLRPALSALLDEAEAAYRREPTVFRETSEAELKRHE